MRLLIDAGNSRLKWQLDDSGVIVDRGAGALGDVEPVTVLAAGNAGITRVAISTVASEENRLRLLGYVNDRVAIPATCYWAEPDRGGLVNAYHDYRQMGADRWHAMYGAWQDHKRGFAVVDAGSAITVDYVDSAGRHLGGFILPGLTMMLRSLKVDAARIGFDPDPTPNARPGVTTGECVNQGLAWLTSALVDRVYQDSQALGLADILVTGGDAQRLLHLGLVAECRASLVLDGLAVIDTEAQVA
jgi:type III pantothenate kinase